MCLMYPSAAVNAENDVDYYNYYYGDDEIGNEVVVWLADDYDDDGEDGDANEADITDKQTVLPTMTMQFVKAGNEFS